MPPAPSRAYGTPSAALRPAEGKSHLGVSSKGSNTLAAKVSVILSTSYSDAEFRGTVGLLDSREIKNDSQTRRRFRLDLQKEVIERNGEILDGFSSVSEQLRHIKVILDNLNTVYAEMQSKVGTSHRETDSALKEASILVEKRHGVWRRQQFLQAMRARFVLSEDEELLLTSTAEPVNDDFFVVLSKVKKISQECEVLLGFEKQTLASEIMEKASKNLGFGYQKLYKWIQREFKNLDLENPQMTVTMRKALTVLAARPSLFQNCLDFFAEARQRILTDSFYAALIGNDSPRAGAAVKPIDMIAHDPLRYVGDMLAWVHSAAVGEREVLEVLFVAEGDELAKGMKSGRDSELWRIISDGEEEEFNTVQALNDLVDRDVSGAARILRQRVEQVIQTNEDSILTYKLANLLKFYGVMLLKLLGSGSSLLNSVQNLEKEAMRQFRALLREHLAAVRAEPQSIPSDLNLPSFLQDSLKQVEVILGTYATSMSAAREKDEDIDQVLAEAIDPFVLDSEALAKSMPPPRSSIYLINCRSAAAKCFKQSSLTIERAERLRILIEEEALLLRESQLDFFRQGSGLLNIISSLRQNGQPELTALTTSALVASSAVLDHFLPSAYIDALERLGLLQDSGLARTITDEAAEHFCHEFELLEEHIDREDATNDDKISNLRSVFPRTASEIRVLLS